MRVGPPCWRLERHDLANLYTCRPGTCYLFGMDESSHSWRRHLHSLIVAIVLLGSVAHGQAGMPEHLAGLRDFCLRVDAQSTTLPEHEISSDITDTVLRQAQLYGLRLSTNCRFMARPGEELTHGLIYITTWSQGSAVTTQIHVINLLIEPALASVWSSTSLAGDVPESIRSTAHRIQARAMFDEFMLNWRSQNP